MMGAMLLSVTSIAQLKVEEDFEAGPAALAGNCWLLNNVKWAGKQETPAYIIAGTGSIYSDPPVNDNNFRTLASPFLDIDGTLSLSFTYQVSPKLKPGATRIIEVGLMDKDGAFIPVGKRAVLDHNTAAGTHEYILSDEPVSGGVYRVMIRMGGTGGDGNARLIMDNLVIDAPYHYSTGCNPAPVAMDDAARYIKGSSFSSPSVLDNDSDPGGEKLTPVLVEGSPDGTITLKVDGTFTFTPHEGFTGTSTTFTYKVVDDGYSLASSNTARVTVEIVEPETTVMHLVGFSGQLQGHHVQLQWEVGDNEGIDYFEVEQSSNGVTFRPVKTVMASNTPGVQRYEVLESEAGAGKLYRLKMVSRKGTAAYSAVIRIEAVKAGGQQLVSNNPVLSSLQVRYNATAAGRATVTVLHTNGMVAFTTREEAHKGLNQYTFPEVSSLKPGTYVLSITTAQGEQLTRLFLKM